MNESGRMFDVLVEEYFREDEKTGLNVRDSIYNFRVWADKKTWGVIKHVEGVVRTIETEYGYVAVAVDKRYDESIVKKEIEATILCYE